MLTLYKLFLMHFGFSWSLLQMLPIYLLHLSNIIHLNNKLCQYHLWEFSKCIWRKVWQTECRSESQMRYQGKPRLHWSLENCHFFTGTIFLLLDTLSSATVSLCDWTSLSLRSHKYKRQQPFQVKVLYWIYVGFRLTTQSTILQLLLIFSFLEYIHIQLPTKLLPLSCILDAAVWWLTALTYHN